MTDLQLNNSQNNKAQVYVAERFEIKYVTSAMRMFLL